MGHTGKTAIVATRLARRTHLAMGMAVALAIALAAPGVAFAVGEGNYPLDIRVDAAREGEDVVSVVVPSSVSIVVRTSVVDGRIMGVQADAAHVTNNRHSFAPIAVSITQVADGFTIGQKLLPYVDMALTGDHRVALVAGSNVNEPLFDSIAPSEERDLGVELSQKDPNQLVPAGSYAVRATLLVTPLKGNVDA